jgi:hypothetical protein
MFEFLNIPERVQSRENKRRAFDTHIKELQHAFREGARPQLILGGLVAGGSFLKMLFGKRSIGLKKLTALAAPLILKLFLSRLSKSKKT